MTVLGPAILDHCQQREIERGVQTLLIGTDRVFKDAAERAKVGDLWWVKETYCEVQSGATGPQFVHEMIPGSPTGMIKNIPAHLRPYFHQLRQRHVQPAAGLRRGESRATLRIVEITPEGFRCEVHMQNVDVFLCRAA